MKLAVKMSTKHLMPASASVLELMLLATFSLFFCRTAQGAFHYYDFVVKETNFTRLCSTKSILTVNDSFPGPELRVRKGDTAFVNVRNQGNHGLTIHWHGVRMLRNPWSDGPENITQCPIPAGTNFTQEITFSQEEGTLWWHAHSDWTRATVHGPIVILPAKGIAYPFPTPHGEQTILLASWYKADVRKVYEEAVASGGEFKTSDAFTINGLPGNLYDCSKGDIYNMTVHRGRTYLLRIINSILNEEMFFAIANHTMTVVGSDGEYLKQHTTNIVYISPGQTMDVLVKANQLDSHYYLAARAFHDSVVPFDNTTTTALFNYAGNYPVPQTVPLPALPGYNDSGTALNFTKQLRSLASYDHPVRVPIYICRRIFMTVSVNLLDCSNNSCPAGSTNGVRVATSLNNISFATQSIDILQAYYNNISGVFTSDYPLKPHFYFNFTGDTKVSVYTVKATKVIVLDYGEAVELVYQGTNVSAADNHPMHLHGYNFYVVATGTGNYNNETDPLSYNLIDPPSANTISVPTRGWTAIRFVADNPGVWFMHCHIEKHTTWGMSTVIIVRNGHTKAQSMRRPPSYMPPCSTS